MRRAAGVVFGATVLLLAGCASTPSPPTPTTTVTTTATATTTVTASPTSPAPTSTPAAGCPSNGVPVPAGADTATVGDVDDSDSDATEFYSEQPRFEFGVHTASGATVVLGDDLAGPATHSGWIARLASGPVAVLDDGRSATLHAFVGCRFVTPIGVDGQPYRFALNGFGTAGTGVACGEDVDGTRKLLGVNAVQLANGRYRIDTTVVTVSADGRTAKNGAVTRGTTTFAAGSSQVRQANDSLCGDVPKVHTSGR